MSLNEAGDFDINAMAQDIYEYAKNKGWWDHNRSFAECIALAHSELTEAFNALPIALDHAKRHLDTIDERSADKDIFSEVWYREKDGKPEGFLYELADVIIRLLDASAHFKIDLKVGTNNLLAFEDTKRGIVSTMSILLLTIHSRLSDALEAWRDNKENDEVAPHKDLEGSYYGIGYSIAAAIVAIEINMFVLGCGDIWKYVQNKHEFNLAREYRHGGKRA